MASSSQSQSQRPQSSLLQVVVPGQDVSAAIFSSTSSHLAPPPTSSSSSSTSQPASGIGAKPNDAAVVLGGGLRQAGYDGRVVATVAGPLLVVDAKAKSMGAKRGGMARRAWVAEARRRYVPAVGDVVVGVVVESLGETYSVDINAPRLASLDALAFDGASKRN